MMMENSIVRYEINSGKPGPQVLVVAGVHGDEYEPMVAARKIVTEFTNKLTNGNLVVVPIANESAYKRQDRCGSDLLDLARSCPGEEQGIDTLHIAYQLAGLIRQADYLIDMHTGGLTYDIYPMVGYMLVDDPVVLLKQQDLAIETGFSLIWGTDSKPNGRTLSVARDSGIPALYFEYGGGTGFRTNVVEAYAEAVERILVKLNMLPRHNVGASLGWTYWLEDYRIDSGHLQRKMPAHAEGVFIAEVSVGDWVITGQCLGRIVDPIQGRSSEIYAETSGLVFLLRTRIYVEKGDALGSIMEVKPHEKIVVNYEQ